MATKKTTLRHCYFSVILLLFLLTLAFSAVPVMAAQNFKCFTMYAGSDPVKYNGYYFWVKQDSSSQTAAFYCGKSTKKGIVLKEYTYISWSPQKMLFLTDGETVIFTDAYNKKKNTYKSSIYTVSVTGKNQKKYGKYSSVPNLLMVYGSKIYYDDNNIGSSSIWWLDLNSKKTRCVWKKIESDEIKASSRYICEITEKAKQVTVKVLDMKNGKLAKTYTVKKNSDEYAQSLSITDKFFFFYIKNEDKEISTVYRVPLSKLSKPQKVTSIKGNAVVDGADDTYIYYSMHNNKNVYYRYHISKKKASKMKDQAYAKAVGFF